MNILKFHGLTASQKIPLSVLNRSFYVSAPLWNQSFYEVLQIPENSTQSEIKDAYYKLSKIYHPDVKKDDNSLAMFRKITEAYDVLGNLRTRLEYDNKVCGKYTPYDTSKQRFYSSLYRDQILDGVRRPEVNKILDKKPFIDKYLASEYKDRLAEYRMYKNQYYEHYLPDKAYGEFGQERTIFFWLVSGLCFAFKFFEWSCEW